MTAEPAPSRRPDDNQLPLRPHGWEEWYSFARTALGYAHAESAEYANLRYVEERNREPAARADGTTSPR